MKMVRGMVMGLVLLSAAACTVIPEGRGTASAPAEDKPYPFDFCFITGEEFSPYKEPYVIRHEGQVYKVCCQDCYYKFKDDPAPHVEMFNEQVRKLENGTAGTDG